MSRFFFAWAAETCSTIKVLFLCFLSDPGPESEPEPVPESESISSPESDSEQPYHDSAPLSLRPFLVNLPLPWKTAIRDMCKTMQKEHRKFMVTVQMLSL